MDQLLGNVKTILNEKLIKAKTRELHDVLLEKIGEEDEEKINNNIKSLIEKAKKIVDSRKKS